VLALRKNMSACRLIARTCLIIQTPAWESNLIVFDKIKGICQ
jgi:hypothetical protein